MEKQKSLSKAYEEIAATGALRHDEDQINEKIILNGMKAYNERSSYGFTNEDIEVFMQEQKNAVDLSIADFKIQDRIMR